MPVCPGCCRSGVVYRGRDVQQAGVEAPVPVMLAIMGQQQQRSRKAPWGKGAGAVGGICNGLPGPARHTTSLQHSFVLQLQKEAVQQRCHRPSNRL
mmetsp:Transcript_4855/g.8463  ORF Transcript_4855/g.8463 Transcript_4855/m.8463 type:complete len:96 (-) Transcript_4855:1147-1434(-)